MSFIVLVRFGNGYYPCNADQNLAIFTPGTFVSNDYVEIYWDLQFLASEIECL